MHNKFKDGGDEGEDGGNPGESNQNEEINPIQEASKTTETKVNEVKNIISSVNEEKLTNKQNEIILPKEDEDFDFNNPVKCYFEKVKIVTDEAKNNSELGSFGMFYCEKESVGNYKCDQEDLLCCPNCMKKVQKIYHLNEKYLVNHRGKVCTLKNNQMYCKGKYRKEVVVNGITYSYNYVCGHSGQCDGCKRLTQFVDKYYPPKLLEKLRQRKKK